MSIDKKFVLSLALLAIIAVSCDRQDQKLSGLLSSVNGTLNVSVSQFSGNRLTETAKAEITGDQQVSKLTIEETEWQCSIQVSSVAEQKNAVDLFVTCKVMSGEIDQANVILEFKFDDWSTENYVLMPGAVYNGNRFRVKQMEYPPLFRDTADHRLDMPVTIGDIPHLNKGEGHSILEQTTGDLSVPSMGFQSGGLKRGMWILTEQANNYGNLGMTVEESDDRSTAIFRITSPHVRQTRATISERVPSEDKGAHFQKGDELTLHARLFIFDAEEVQQLFDKYVKIRNDIMPHGQCKHTLPFSAAWEIQEKKYNAQNWDDDRGYYSVEMRQDLYNDWQLGWIGGCISSYPLLIAGSDISQKRSLINLETVFRKTQAQSGFFYGIGNGKEWYSDGFFTPHPYNMHFVRKSADALYYLQKHIRVLEKQNPQWQCPAYWKNSIRKLADAFVRVWNEYGQFGQFVDVETGKLLVGGSSAGAIVPAGLALASNFLNNPKYLEIAEKSAQYFYNSDVKNGLTTGGPAEILQAPDSESAFALLESFIVLYETTGNEKWLAFSEQIAHQCATWCVAYDYKFPEHSTFGKLDMRTTGSIFANAQNKCSTPAICTFSGNSLFKLYRATGNPFYLELITDIAHNIPQYLSRKDRPVSEMDPGWMCERVQMGDWESHWLPVGEIFNGSNWCEVSLMLTWLEIPGLYIQPDKKFVWAIDHVDAEFIEEDGEKVKVRLRNPTKFDAQIKALVESSGATKTVLPVEYPLNFQIIELQAGETKDVWLNI